MIQLSWEDKKDTIKEDFNTNVFVATFTTCWARLKLYEVLEMLQERVLYFDTDSVIFVSRPCDQEPEVGSFLGQLTSELKPNEHIVEFVSGGPKNYAYRTSMGQEVCKVKGFSLNYANSRLINFKSMLDLIVCTSEQQDIVDEMEQTTPDNEVNKSTETSTDKTKNVKYITVTNEKKISRLKSKRIIYNRQEKKKYKIVYSKRVIQKNTHDTLPYGY